MGTCTAELAYGMMVSRQEAKNLAKHAQLRGNDGQNGH